jgi:spore photoproduct lyase
MSDSYEPRPVRHFRPRRIVLARGSLDTPASRSLCEKISAVYPKAEVVEDLESPHNAMLRDVEDLHERHRLGKQTLVIGEHDTPVGESGEAWSACPNYRHFSVYGFCPYSCDYCYLAGTLFSSPTVRIFVNVEKILDKIRETAAGFDRPTAFYHGKLQDGLALDPLAGYSREIVPFFSEHPYARMTLLTKSADVENLLDLDHRGHTILSWSLNPPAIARRFERNAPDVPDRIEAMRRCAEAGYPVRAVVMPILPLDDWRESYGPFIEDLLGQVRLDRITLGSICSYSRAVTIMQGKLGRENPISCSLGPARRKNGDGRRRFDMRVRLEVYRFLVDAIRRVRPDLQIGLCLDDPKMFELLGLEGAVGRCNCVL